MPTTSGVALIHDARPSIHYCTFSSPPQFRLWNLVVARDPTYLHLPVERASPLAARADARGENVPSATKSAPSLGESAG
jgi:hypothetical protein